MIDRQLKADAELSCSDVVANNAMNRVRGLTGVNSYERCLGFNPVTILSAGAGWLDLCCGAGRALIEAAAATPSSVTLTGVDLVDYFEAVSGPRPRFEVAPLPSWQPDQRYELITCVHGLHYVGDKLGLLAQIAGWLTDEGILVADFDMASVRVDSGSVATVLRQAGFQYDRRRKLIKRRGAGAVSLPYRYLGADDRDGPNYTGQPAVASYYQCVPPHVAIG